MLNTELGKLFITRYKSEEMMFGDCTYDLKVPLKRYNKEDKSYTSTGKYVDYIGGYGKELSDVGS